MISSDILAMIVKRLKCRKGLGLFCSEEKKRFMKRSSKLPEFLHISEHGMLLPVLPGRLTTGQTESHLFPDGEGSERGARRKRQLVVASE